MTPTTVNSENIQNIQLIEDLPQATRNRKRSVPANSIHPENRGSWRAWLAAHHAKSKGVWFISYKMSTNKPRVTYEEAVEEALCFGWIDSKPAKLDEERSMLWFSPRKLRSNWSKPNKDRVEQLIAKGLMTKAGMNVIRAAQTNGAWNALDSLEKLEIPTDLNRAFDVYPGSRTHFKAFPNSVKRGILEWILNARRNDTRTNRIQETALLAQQNRRANQWQPKTNAEENV